MASPPIRLLLAEDELAHADAIERAFATSATKVALRVVGTLRAYRGAIVTDPPDIAILDLNLPDGRAVEVLVAPPEAGPFPILVMTSHGDEQLAVAAIKAGALDYIVKSPETFAAMPQAVARALREWRLLTGRKQAEAALAKTHQELVDASRQAGMAEFATGVL